MRVVLQRVSNAAVTVADETIGVIREGLLVFAGFAPPDTTTQVDWCAAKMADLRIFPDRDGKMAHSVVEVGGSVLVVPQFTLYGSVRRGRRPDFAQAAPPAVAEPLYQRLLDQLAQRGIAVQGGRFGAHMAVQLVNDGPVTFYIDTDEVMPSGI